MKTTMYKNPVFLLIAALVLLPISSCARDLDELETATFPTNGDIFIDGFSGGLEYNAYGDSKVTAFEVDNDVVYKGEASMRFEVPDAGDPLGGYAGGIFKVPGGRDLTGYNALTFWIRSSQAATLNEVGFGQDFDGAPYLVNLRGLCINTNWQKVIIPIPDPSKLTQEQGMLHYAEGPENDKGYTFWIDEVQFEQLGTIAYPRGVVQGGLDQFVQAETGGILFLGGTSATFNMPTGTDRTVEATAAYFDFVSSDPSVATVNEFGLINVIDSGTAVITAQLANAEAVGSLTVESIGDPLRPNSLAPVPTQDPADVISLFSNAYTNVPVDVWNTYWEFSTAETEEVQVDGDDMLRYKNLNFVGIEFTSQTIDINEMTHFHMDIWTPDPTAAPAVFRVNLVDFGPNNTFDGGDDSNHELTFTSPLLQTEQWVSIDVPLTQFAGLVRKGNLAQMVLSGDLPNVFVDNVYFYDDGSGMGVVGPASAAPTPTANAADVISLFSNAYTNVMVDTWNTGWQFSTAVTEELEIEGDDVLKYTGLNFVGIEFVTETIDITDMTHFHIDIWTPDPTAAAETFKVNLVDFGPNNVFDGGDDTNHELTFTRPLLQTEQWVSIDVPLSQFTGLTGRRNLAQMVLSGELPTVYVDNVYFYK